MLLVSEFEWASDSPPGTQALTEHEREAKKRETRTILVLAVVIIIVASGVAGVRVRVGI